MCGETELREDGRIWYQGMCHCGSIKFEAAASPDVTLTECTCLICYMSGHRELMVSDDRFRLHRGKERLREYRFANCIADHTFCIVCGVRPFYKPRSHPVGFISVNARCLDLSSAKSITIVEFDGKNWEQNISSGKHIISK